MTTIAYSEINLTIHNKKKIMGRIMAIANFPQDKKGTAWTVFIVFSNPIHTEIVRNVPVMLLIYEQSDRLLFEGNTFTFEFEGWISGEVKIYRVEEVTNEEREKKFHFNDWKEGFNKIWFVD